MNEKTCAGCEARDSHIISLREQITYLREQLAAEQSRLMRVSGIERESPANVSQDFTAIRRHNSSIQSRIQRAEAGSADPALMEQRKKEYNDRINQLLRPETELVDPQ